MAAATFSVPQVLATIDHAVLKPTQAEDDVREACQMAQRLEIASVCVKPSHVALASYLLADSTVLVSTVIGFPHGGTTTKTKVAEAKEALAAGASELDMVANLGKVAAKDAAAVTADIAAVVDAAGEAGAIVKVILETGLFTDNALKRQAAEAALAASPAFLKTSTGFGTVAREAGGLQATGATAEDVQLLLDVAKGRAQVKASGGIANLAEATAMLEMGATRLGTSRTLAIATGEGPDSAGY